MYSARVGSLSWLLVGVALAATGLLAPRVGADDDPVRRQILALNDVTGSEPIEGQIKALAADKDQTKKLLAVAQKMAKEKNQPIQYNGAMILGRTAHQLRELETAEAFYRLCAAEAGKLQSGYKMAQAMLGLIDVCYDNQKFEETVKLCREFMEIPGDKGVERAKLAVLERMIEALTRQEKVDEALKVVNRLVEAEAEENGWWYLQLKGWVYRESGQFEQAGKTYEDVIERIRKDKTLKKEDKARYTQRARYILSGVYVDLKDIDKASEALQALLKEKPDDPTYNNDLGYIWADHDRNLDEAERMIRKAIDEDRKSRENLKKKQDLEPEEDVDNAAYLDSLGWVLYKKKNYADAKKYFLEAVKQKEGQHVEILDHLAETYKAMGAKDDAIATWKKALKLPNTSKREKERKTVVEKKLKELEP